MTDQAHSPFKKPLESEFTPDTDAFLLRVHANAARVKDIKKAARENLEEARLKVNKALAALDKCPNMAGAIAGEAANDIREARRILEGAE